MHLTERKILKLRELFKTIARTAYRLRLYSLCQRFIQAASYINYTFNFGFTDDEIETLLKNLSYKLSKRQNLENCDFDDTARCAFFDSFTTDNKGLTQQYIRALMAARKNILFMYELSAGAAYAKDILSELKAYGKAILFEVKPIKSTQQKSQLIYDKLIEYKPSSLFMHLAPSDISPLVAFYALNGIVSKYRINLTDHTYWSGIGCVDYSIEFRQYGCDATIYCRGISADNVFLHPFYPIMNQTPFAGFNVDTAGKVIILSGGAYYKIIDKEDSFFKIVKAIVQHCPNTIVLFAGGGDDNLIKQKIAEYGLQGKMYLIGFRNDLVEIYKHSDIFLNTYPAAGGLMCQFAAHLAVPAVGLTDDKCITIESLVCQTKSTKISSTTLDELLNETEHLANDEEYRHARGRLINKCVQSIEQFNRQINDILNRKTPIPYSATPGFKPKTYNLQDKLAFENKNLGFCTGISKILGPYSLLTLNLTIPAVIKKLRHG